MKWIFIAMLALVGCDGSNTATVMLVGDSISLGYTQFVQQDMSDNYIVFHATGGPGAGNDRTSTYFLAHIDRIMQAAGPVTIIHANWGLWDMVHTHDHGVDAYAGNCFFSLPSRTPLDKYRDNLEQISAVFEKSGARIILATTTPVPATNKCIHPEDIVAYNKVIVDVAKEHGFAVDDLYTLMLPYDYLHKARHNAHYVDEGYQLMAYQVAQNIESVSP